MWCGAPELSRSSLDLHAGTETGVLAIGQIANRSLGVISQSEGHPRVSVQLVQLSL